MKYLFAGALAFIVAFAVIMPLAFVAARGLIWAIGVDTSEPSVTYWVIMASFLIAAVVLCKKLAWRAVLRMGFVPVE